MTAFALNIQPAVIGMDLLILAVESYLTTDDSNIEQGENLKVILLLLKVLPLIYDIQSEPFVSEQLTIVEAFTIKSHAQTNCRLNDGLSRVISRAFTVPENRLKAILLPAVINTVAAKARIWNQIPGRNLLDFDQRIARIVAASGVDVNSPEDGVAKFVLLIRKLRAQLHLPRSISECLVDESDYLAAVPDLAFKVFHDQYSACSPRLLDIEDIEQILKDIYRKH